MPIFGLLCAHDSGFVRAWTVVSFYTLHNFYTHTSLQLTQALGSHSLRLAAHLPAYQRLISPSAARLSVGCEHRQQIIDTDSPVTIGVVDASVRRRVWCGEAHRR